MEGSSSLHEFQNNGETTPQTPDKVQRKKVSNKTLEYRIG